MCLRAAVDISEKGKHFLFLLLFFCNLDSKPGPCIPFFCVSSLLLYPLQYAFILNVFAFCVCPLNFLFIQLAYVFTLLSASHLSCTRACSALFDLSCLYVYIRW